MSLEVPEVSEDCLYVNVYTPSKPGDNTNLPVSYETMPEINQLRPSVMQIWLLNYDITVYINSVFLKLRSVIRLRNCVFM